MILYYIKTIMEGAFPSGRDSTKYLVSSETYDKIVDILVKEATVKL